MTIQLYRLSNEVQFPHPSLALNDPNGLLAYGGDLSVARLVLAYQHGIFPWFSEGEPILWWSPDPRGILELDNFYASKSLRKLARSGRYSVTLNRDFKQVIRQCASVPRNDSGTWITEQMIQAYIELHKAGHSHSVEIWDGPELVGGLYGVAVGRVFCGESMFHHRSNTSKLAMLALVQHLKQAGFAFIDCQLQNDHLASLGVTEMPRQAFLVRLREAVVQSVPSHCWQPQELKIHELSAHTKL
ncbi:Leucyltransferase [Saliniradius amylolyticus]|uniref:Leucyl/phenylalanyl-tRNA--protein transferase n=1 Tax=Saliniradius amylolyticus TaxID=2183582 RepID=A0A2S2E360_9ALTE|nr:leucyl/phenylalanyl-tRNA--protein transferase [Saliniradius amylolyticus]AWL12085.1 Leucyltransferase [Saliniradius amylolyticus]